RGLAGAKQPRGDTGRGLAAMALHCKGDSKAAQEAILEAPLDVRVHYQPETLSKLERTSSGRALLEAHQKQWAGVVEPLRYIQAAIIYLDLKDADALRFALDRAAETMGGHPGLKVLHRVLEACSSAEAGKSDDAERRLKQGREILEGPIGRVWN